MLNRIQNLIIMIGAAIVALIIAFLSGQRRANVDQEVNEYVRAREATMKRESIDDEVDQSTDLVDRAERAGILRDN